MNGNVNLVEEQRMHRADAVRNTNSKNIFREPLLYAQFLRDNLNIPALKNVRPEYIVDVIASVMKALCVKIDAGEEETDRCIQKVKERKMGYLFENMEKMSIREERRLRAEAEQRADEAEKHLEEAEKRAEEVEKQAEQRVKEAEKRAAEAEKRAREALEELERKKRKQC